MIQSEAYGGFESIRPDQRVAGAGPSVEAMPADPFLESPGARRPMEESTTTANELGDGERLASMADEPAVVLGETAGAAGPSEAEARVADATLETRAEKPVVPEGQTALPEASEGMVRHVVRPLSPLVVPPAAEEDEVEEIERKEASPQAVRILRKQGDEVVVVEEEDTTREVRRLESTLATTMKQINVSIASAMSVCVVEDRSSS